MRISPLPGPVAAVTLALFRHLLTSCSASCVVGQVSDAIHLSRKTLDKIRQNLAWAFGYNAISIPLAAGVLLPTMGICLTPSISGALMGLSSVMVVSNSLLLQVRLRGPADSR